MLDGATPGGTATGREPTLRRALLVPVWLTAWCASAALLLLLRPPSPNVSGQGLLFAAASLLGLTALLVPWRRCSTRVKILLVVGWACSLCLLCAAVVVGLDLACRHGYVTSGGSCAYE